MLLRLEILESYQTMFVQYWGGKVLWGYHDSRGEASLSTVGVKYYGGSMVQYYGEIHEYSGGYDDLCGEPSLSTVGGYPSVLWGCAVFVIRKIPRVW